MVSDSVHVLREVVEAVQGSSMGEIDKSYPIALGLAWAMLEIIDTDPKSAASPARKKIVELANVLGKEAKSAGYPAGFRKEYVKIARAAEKAAVRTAKKFLD